jgi:hypothetical protein
MTGLHNCSIHISYWISNALIPDDRRTCEHDLLRHYLDRLREHGGEVTDFDEAWDAYRRHMVHGLFHTANADEMYPEDVNCTVIGRHSAAVKDLDTLELLLG